MPKVNLEESTVTVELNELREWLLEKHDIKVRTDSELDVVYDGDKDVLLLEIE